MRTSRTCPPAIWRSNQYLRDFVGKRAKIVQFTRVHAGPKGLVHRCPYYVALVEAEGMDKRFMVEVCRENDSAVDKGIWVEMILRKHLVSPEGLIFYSLKARVL